MVGEAINQQGKNSREAIQKKKFKRKALILNMNNKPRDANRKWVPLN